jgi:hypothetical protein
MRIQAQGHTRTGRSQPMANQPQGHPSPGQIPQVPSSPHQGKPSPGIDTPGASHYRVRPVSVQPSPRPDGPRASRWPDHPRDSTGEDQPSARTAQLRASQAQVAQDHPPNQMVSPALGQTKQGEPWPPQAKPRTNPGRGQETVEPAEPWPAQRRDRQL